MAFTAPRDTDYPFGREGDLIVARGSFANDGGSTGGTIVTGLNHVVSATLQHTGGSVVASAPSISANSAGSITIVTVANTTGLWIAYGK